MSNAIQTSQIPTLNSIYRMQWEDSQESWVLLYPEGMVQLNGSAGEIMAQVDGQRTVADIIAVLESKFPEAGDLSADIIEFIGVAHEHDWIEFS
ncbi:pyrroloquinoline quinone biosynthesis peptide chaperone PqqD [Oceanobacter kriegii]|uniref:pyrroloquinoline quinone biosynthesis peptide chaperone PqqD n=1 Tax=Oceanobacter kriegii TaxID=64972 RepID=UPI0004031A0A|nr:pyrroloquinoline quinone biosynthesis peptide chaperone PqqD [Oceanobacter kriegii]